MKIILGKINRGALGVGIVFALIQYLASGSIIWAIIGFAAIYAFMVWAMAIKDNPTNKRKI